MPHASPVLDVRWRGKDGEEDAMRVLDTLTPEAWRSYQRDAFPAGSWVCEAGMLRTVAEADPR